MQGAVAVLIPRCQAVAQPRGDRVGLAQGEDGLQEGAELLQSLSRGDLRVGGGQVQGGEVDVARIALAVAHAGHRVVVRIGCSRRSSGSRRMVVDLSRSMCGHGRREGQRIL